jgi:lipopolysaccharide biosynthesis glycosyltransferase
MSLNSKLFPKVLVGQVMIGDFPGADLYRNIFMPSVENWARNLNYDYLVIKNKLYEFRCLQQDIIAQRFVFFGLYEEYDYFIHIDADAVVTEHANNIPLVDFGAVVDSQDTADRFGAWMHLKQPYFNAGIFIVSSCIAKQLWIKAHLLMNGHYDHLMSIPLRDQNVLNKWIDELGVSYVQLPNKWNTMPHQINWSDRKMSNIIHYAGDKNQSSFSQILKNDGYL